MTSTWRTWNAGAAGISPPWRETRLPITIHSRAWYAQTILNAIAAARDARASGDGERFATLAMDVDALAVAAKGGLVQQ